MVRHSARAGQLSAPGGYASARNRNSCNCATRAWAVLQSPAVEAARESSPNAAACPLLAYGRHWYGRGLQVAAAQGRCCMGCLGAKGGDASRPGKANPTVWRHSAASPPDVMMRCNRQCVLLWSQGLKHRPGRCSITHVGWMWSVSVFELAFSPSITSCVSLVMSCKRAHPVSIVVWQKRFRAW